MGVREGIAQKNRMSRQENSNTDKSSSKSLADLYEKVRDCWTQEIQSLLDSTIDGVKDINDWLLTAKEIDHLIKQVSGKKGGIKSSFSFQLRKNLNDFKNMRETLSHRDMAQGWRGMDSIAHEGPEQNPELKSIIKQYNDEYADIIENLFQKLQVCVNRSDVDVKQNPISIRNLCYSFRNSIDNLHLETKYEAALYRFFASKILSDLTPRYQMIEDLLVGQSISSGLGAAKPTPETTQETGSKKTPASRESLVKNKNPKNLNEQKPPESIVISRDFELLCLLHEYKKKAQLASSLPNNILTELKENLAALKITEIDKEVDHVSFLFNFIFDNKKLPEEIKALLAKLQIFVLMSVMNEAKLLSDSDNPIHILLDAIVDSEVELVELKRSEQSSNQLLNDGINRLIENQAVTAESYTELLKQYRKHIEGLHKQDTEEALKENLREEDRIKKQEKVRLEKVTEQERLEKAAKQQQLEKDEKEKQRLDKIEQARLQKIEQQRLEKAAEQQQLEKD